MRLLGENTVYATLGGNVDIVWRLYDILELNTAVSLYKTELTSENEVSSSYFFISQRTENIPLALESPLLELKFRSKLVYNFTGMVDDLATGRIIFSISNLRFSDSRRYILINRYGIKSETILKVRRKFWFG